MRLIDADVACKGCVRYGTDLSCESCVVNDAPTIDAVAVVRCRECKYLMFSDCYGECSKGYLGIVRPDDFCSYGERKEGADNGC